MSREKTPSEPKKLIPASPCFQRAILRAYGEEPILRNVCMREDGIVMATNDRIGKESEHPGEIDSWIGWPAKDIYCYDFSVFESLSQLYNDGEVEKLREVWPTLIKLFA